MTVYETDLPGVGKKFEIDLVGDEQLIVVIHNTGKREVHIRSVPDADAEKLFELSDQLARQVGTILEGAYFQPIQTGTIDTVLNENALIEWTNVTEESPLVGRTLGEADLRRKTGVSVVAIQRGEETIANPDASTTLKTGDTLVVLGSREACAELNQHLGAETDEQ